MVKDRRAYRLKNIEKIRAQERAVEARRKAKYPDYGRTKLLEFKERRRAIIRAAKDIPCTDCHRQYPYYVMDLDHVRGTKVINLGLAIARGYSERAIHEEIAKCDVVCANCHRERTYQRKQSEKTPSQF